MGAPKNAEPLVFVGDDCEYGGKKLTYDDALQKLPSVTCNCGWKGSVIELLEDPDDPMPNSTMWCPQCNTSGWIYD